MKLATSSPVAIRGRENDSQVTIYKSLGHVAQDLAATAYLHGASLLEAGVQAGCLFDTYDRSVAYLAIDA